MEIGKQDEPEQASNKSKTSRKQEKENFSMNHFKKIENHHYRLSSFSFVPFP